MLTQPLESNPIFDIIVFAVSIGAFAVPFYGLVGSYFTSIIIVIILLTSLILLLHEGTQLKLTARLLSKYVNIEIEEGTSWMMTEEGPDLEGRTKDDIIDNIDQSFPTGVILASILIQVVTITIDWNVNWALSNQTYGLIFDGAGGLLLVRERFRGTFGGMSLDSNAHERNSVEGIWGFILLGTGFSLQYFSILVR